jgi:hypothetical protein
MEQFMQQVRAYAKALGVEPTTVVQRAAKVSGAAWSRWDVGAGSPTLATADKILKYIADNPAPEAKAEPLKAVG